MMALVIGSYYLLYLPATIESLFTYDEKAKFYVSRLCYFLFFANALVNPFIYSGQSSEFNAAYRKMLGLKPKTQLDLNKTQPTQIQSVQLT